MMVMYLEMVWAATNDWFWDHGKNILLIIFIASLIRRFGMIFLGRIIGRSIRHSDRFENDRDRNLRIETLKGLFSSILKVVTWFIVVLMVLAELNVLKLLMPMLATAGLASLIIGFGIQTFVKDFISGIFIVAENQYRVGDYIAATASVGGVAEGTVVRITLRTTVLRDLDGAIHFIPNGNITRAANQTLDYAKINIFLTLPLIADLDAAEREINKLGEKIASEERWKHTFVLEPYYHGVHEFDGNGVLIEVRAKTAPAEQWTVTSEMRKRLLTLLNEKDRFETKTKAAKPKSNPSDLRDYKDGSFGEARRSD